MLFPTSQQMQRNANYEQIMAEIDKEKAGHRYTFYLQKRRTIRQARVAWWFFATTIVMIGLLLFFLTVIARDTSISTLLWAIGLAVSVVLWDYHQTSAKQMKWAIASTGTLALAEITSKKEPRHWWVMPELQYAYKDHLGITRKSSLKKEQYRFFWQQQPYRLDKGMKLVVAYDANTPLNHTVLTDEQIDDVCFSDAQYEAYQRIKQHYQHSILPERIHRIQQIIIAIIGIALGFPVIFLIAFIVLQSLR